MNADLQDEYKLNNYCYSHCEPEALSHMVQGEGRGNLTPSRPSPLGDCVAIRISPFDRLRANG
jgi:hypothetical protein